MTVIYISALDVAYAISRQSVRTGNHDRVMDDSSTLTNKQKFFILLSHWNFSPWEIGSLFHEAKPAGTESRFPTLVGY